MAKPKSDNYLAPPKTNLTDSDDFGSAVDIQKKIDITNGAVDEPCTYVCAMLLGIMHICIQKVEQSLSVLMYVCVHMFMT